jgi:TolB-like protein/tetratricopeptide (TPR) repeat protein
MTHFGQGVAKPKGRISSMNDEPEGQGSDPDRLDSWKRIARYLRRGVRTVRRWEVEEAMPVHRHSHNAQGSVFAFRSELDEWLRGRSAKTRAKGASAQQSMVVVLPFQNLSGDPKHEFLADGFTEELIANLGVLPRSQLGVIARTSAMVYKNTKKSINEIALELGVNFIFEGSIRVHEKRVRITGQLIQTSDQTHVWAKSYERDLEDLLTLQSDVSRKIAAEMGGKLLGENTATTGSSAKDSPTLQREVFETYLKARALLYRMTGDSIARSIEAFEEVLAAEPGFAPAYAGLAEALQLATIWVPLPPRQTMPRAFEAISRAVAIDPDSAEAYAVLGFIHYSYTWDWKAAESAFERAIRINPNLAIGHKWYSEFLAAMGRFEEAKARIETAERLDPLSLAVATSRGHVLWLAREPDALIRAMNKIIEIEPRYPLAHIFLILSYAMKGEFQESLERARRAIEICGEDFNLIGLLGASAGLAGQRELAREQLARLEEVSKSQYVPSMLFGGPCLGLGEIDRALSHLEQAIENREWYIATLATSSLQDAFRGHPRFRQMLDQLNLAEVDRIMAEKLGTAHGH